MHIRRSILAATLVVGTALTTAALAQFGGGPMVPPAGTPMTLAGGPMVPAGSGNPFGNGRMPFASGAVQAVDMAAGTVTVAPMFGGTTGTTVKVTGQTQITAQTEGRVSDLKVGDTVQVHGVPTAMTASQITAGDNLDPFMDIGLMGVGGGGTGAMPGQSSSSAPQGLASAQARGKVTRTQPLTIAISDTVSIVLKTAPDVKITRTITEKIGDIKVGDRIMANGKAGDDGVLAASKIRVNPDYGLR